MVIAATALLAGELSAQERPRTSPADSAFAAADIPKADSLFYRAVRQRPRDPIAREALGEYLAMRGASRIAAVLLEEARMFGGDPARIATRLVPLYQSLGDWRALLSLAGAPLTVAERKRAAWLTEHPSAIRADSTSVALVGGVRGDTLGRITIRIAGRPVSAIVVARDVGVIIGSAAALAAIRFGDSTTVVLDSISIGRVRLTVVPAKVKPGLDGAIIGFAALSPMTVTFDYARKRVLFNQLRSGGPVLALPLFRVREDINVALTSPSRWSTLASFIGTAAAGLAARPVTIDLKASEVRTPP